MRRKQKNYKPLIYVFCEGESEEAYANFLKKTFRDVAVIKSDVDLGLFEYAQKKFNKNQSYKNSISETDEIWFFFDLETKDIPKWNERMKIVNKLRKLRKKDGIKVRLLMTTGCIEYWFMLHYKYYNPPLQTVTQKEHVIHQLKTLEKNYAKGDSTSIEKIAINYPNAIINAKKTVSNLLKDGLPTIEDTEERNHWLYVNCKTFSNVYEAIDYLIQLKDANNN